ncbi:MAG: diguanylate cyclase [Gemmatimonadota bacterium]
MPKTQDGSKQLIPPLVSYAVTAAVLAPAVAAILRITLGDYLGPSVDLVWILALVPAFVFTDRWGWRGALLALGWTSTLALLAEFTAAANAGGSIRWFTVELVALLVASASFGAGWLRERWADALLSGGSVDDHRRSRSRDSADDAVVHARAAMATPSVFDFVFVRAVAGARRDPPLSLILFRIDGIDDYDTLYGSNTKDGAEDILIRLLFRHTRQMNTFAMLEDHKFAALLQKEGPEGASAFARRILEESSAADTPWGARVLVSAGISCFDPSGKQPKAMLEQAERALTAARGIGGDSTVVAEIGGKTLTAPGLMVLRPDGSVRELQRHV